MKIKFTVLLQNCRSGFSVALSSLLLMVMVTGAFAQSKISGTVTSSEGGEPLPGVNVIVKGTSSGTVTDIEGKYSLSVPDGAETLSFTFIGYASQDVAIGGRSTIDVALGTDTQQLNEVVVTALGIERQKNELTYAAQEVQGEKISQTRETNFVSSLSGKVAGLNIKQNNSLGGSTNVTIRGAKSLTGNNQALFVIDGVPIDNSITNGTSGTGRGGSDQSTGRGGYDYGNTAADVNPDDIASINVLKGAAATALYGSRASNGVIIITTKKGRGKKGLGVTVNTGVTFGIADKSTFPTYQKQYGAGYGAYYTGDPIYGEDGSPNDNPFFYDRDINGDGTPDLVVVTSEDASYGAPFDPNLNVYQWDAFDSTSQYYNTARPWVAGANDPYSFLQTAVTGNHSIFLDGSNDKGYFKVGYNRMAQTGILPNSEITKDIVNLGASYEVTDKLTATASINFTNQQGLGRYGTGYDSRNMMGNFRQWWQTNVDIQEMEDAYNRTGRNITWNWADPSPGSLRPIYWDNPYWTRYENYESDQRLRYLGYVMLNYKIADWISIMGRTSLDSYSELQEERIAVGSVDVSSYSRFNRRYSETNHDLMVNIDKDLSESFNLKGVLGTNIRRTNIESIYAETNGGLVVPQLYAISNSANAIEAPIETLTTLEVDGIFASVDLGYKEFLFLTLTGRRDQASSLPAANNTYYYPSISGGFTFSKLLGTSLPWLSYGKLRANYAEVGNTAAPLSIRDTYTKPTGFGSVPLFSVNGTKRNENLKSERTKSSEIGLEASFVDNRVGFDLSLYKSNSVDQILPVEVSRATGYTYKYVNAGDIENKGIEVALYGSPVKTQNFSWDINVNWSRNRNLVKSLGDIDNLLLGSFQGGVTINATEGQPYGVIRGNDYLYNEQGQRIVGDDGLYELSDNANNIIGNANPDWLGGINNVFRYKNVSLSFLLDMRHGGDVFSLDMYYGLATGLYPETAGNNDLGNPQRASLEDGGGVILPGVTETGEINDVRVNAGNYGLYGYRRNPASGFVYDASYVKLRELIFTYSLPQSIIDNMGPFQGVDVSFVGRNLWILHKNTPYSDPEEGISAGNIQGYQGGAYPLTRNLGFNVKVRF